MATAKESTPSYSKAKIVAPIHGMLLPRHVDPGETAAVGTPLSGGSDHDVPALPIAMSWRAPC